MFLDRFRRIFLNRLLGSFSCGLLNVFLGRFPWGLLSSFLGRSFRIFYIRWCLFYSQIIDDMLFWISDNFCRTRNKSSWTRKVLCTLYVRVETPFIDKDIAEYPGKGPVKQREAIREPRSIILWLENFWGLPGKIALDYCHMISCHRLKEKIFFPEISILHYCPYIDWSI